MTVIRGHSRRLRVTRQDLTLQAVRVASPPGVATSAITRAVIDEVTLPLRLGGSA